MINKKNDNLLVIIFCVIFCITSIVSGIMADNTLHTIHCDGGDCLLCNLIHMSSYFNKNIIIIYVFVLLLFLRIPLIKLIIKNIKK